MSSTNGNCDPRSIMALLSMGLQQGEAITITVEGEGDDALCTQLVELFETEFDFPTGQS